MTEYLNKFLIPKLKSGFEKMALEVNVTQNQIYVGICAFFVACLVANFIKRIRSNYPPGPTGLPIFGYLPFLSENMFLDFTELGKKYGDVFR
ncbi:hypothetical protein NPIL_67851 [Nephila pilipes]|uniref:Uncharacterized protein n=1 Tax=Nephila pilipes TaxID=299642 RepID=A0A8X6NY05_NEPPI|nr:hypothetical protein NPIL_67851 [Nephila pilipes]